MSCNINYDNIIFSVEYVSKTERTHYVFIGNVNIDIKKILDKIENRQKILKDEVLLLSKNYGKYYMNWINVVKNKIKINFIPYNIHIDDSLAQVRQKIFVFCSDFETKKYYLPENQEIWIKKNNVNIVIGYSYINTKTKEKLIINPHLNNEVSEDFEESYLKKDTTYNNILIYEIFEEYKSKSDKSDYTLYFSDAIDELNFLKKKNTKLTTRLINKYFKKYWPFVNLTYDISEIKNNYLLLKDYFLKEDYIFRLIREMKVNPNEYGSCNLLHIIININDKDVISNYLDLYPIFDYLKDNVNYKTPFINYYENILNNPFYIISKEAIDKHMISKDKMKNWVDINNEYRKNQEIVIKRYIKDYDEKPRYSSITISKTGQINLKVAFKSDNNATFKDVESVIKDCKILIEDINNNRLIKKKEEKYEIETPDMSIKENGDIVFKHNTKINFMNIIIPLNLKNPIDYKKLLDFSKKFPFFLAEIPKDIEVGVGNNMQLQQARNKDNSIKFKYKRISNFANMNDILLEIDILKQQYNKDTLYILKHLEKKFKKSADELKVYLLEWEKKYSMKSSKIDSELKQGITVTINDKNILFNGVRKLYHIPLLYRFFITFLSLFNNFDEFMKNKEFKKYFGNKNLNFDAELNYYNNYEYDTTEINNLSKIGNIDYELDENIYLEDEINYLKNMYKEEEIDEQYSMTMSVGMEQLKDSVVGIAKDEEIDPNVTLKCKDSIPDLDTCEDFCNDKMYFLRRLQKYDKRLFYPKHDKKVKTSKYSRSCTKSYPVVLPYNPEDNPFIKRDSYSFSVKYSSEPELFQRWYICPKLWCPYCQLPILEADIDKKTIRKRATKEKGGVCHVAKCPNGDHQLIIRDENTIYPYFLSRTEHPDGLCLPCCSVKRHDDPKSAFYSGFKKCLGDDVENKNIKEGMVYILGKGTPINKDRYGLLSVDVCRILKTNLETGYLGDKSGYLKKGVKQEGNNSFLSAICDLITCDKKNSSITVDKLKHVIIDKLTEDLFKSAYNGNLPNIFHDKTKNSSALDNFKNYILNKNIPIDHKYLWDLLQRDNILFQEGINIFIFENNTLLCPKGENINNFYSITKKSILLNKSKNFYEPIYYVKGDGKNSISICIFDNSTEEIRKLFDIAYNGCIDKYYIEWVDVLKNNIKKYDLKIDNLAISNGIDLIDALKEILINIKNKKLKDNFLPIIQYCDSYNKVFGIGLKNGLYVPVNPSKLIYNIKYKTINNINEIKYIDFNNTLKLYEILSNSTKIDYEITHKIVDSKNKIIALVNKYNRVIPILETDNKDKKLKVSNLNFYRDVDEAISNNIENPDLRVEVINKKTFEDESYMRLKFELSKFLQFPKNKPILDTLLNIIHSDKKNINQSRDKIYQLLNDVYKKLIVIKNGMINFDTYKRPNKRLPCFLNKNAKFGCSSDPHCIYSNNSCKLLINKTNLLSIHDNIDNYTYYLGRITDELLRFKIKRDDIIDDHIPNIIDKNIVKLNPDKYIVINTSNQVEIENMINKIYIDSRGIHIDDRNLYEDITTKEISFNPEKFLKRNGKELIQNNNVETLSVFWLSFFKSSFFVKKDENINKLFDLFLYILQIDKIRNNNNVISDIASIKNKIILLMRQLIKKNNNVEKNILKLYGSSSKNNNIENKSINKEKLTNKKLNIENFQELLDHMLSDTYYGDLVDLNFISKIFHLNIIVLDKRINWKKDKTGINIFYSNDPINDYYIILYRILVIDENKFYLVQTKKNMIFKKNELPEKFVQTYLKINNK